MNFRRWLIQWLYGSLGDWAKYEVHNRLRCPSLDAVLLEQCKQAKRLFGDDRRRGRDAD